MIESIDHVNLVVDDMPGMIRFYRDVLGLRLTREDTIRGPWIDAVTGLANVEAEVAFLELPNGPRIELLHYRTPQSERPTGQNMPNTRGLRHFAFRVQNLDGQVADLKAAGIELVSPIQKAPSSQVDFVDRRKRLLYFHDPEGNLLEFCEFQ